MKNRKIYALGFFDGVHRGHQALLAACRELARERACEAAAVTFDAHPQSVLSGSCPELINTPQDRLRLLREFGAEQVHTLPFDDRTVSMPWQRFFQMLTADMGACGIVCGDDFRFGHRGEGNAEKLRDACAAAGIPCVVVPEQTLNGVRISSTHIRELIGEGEMEKAVDFLGHPHVLTGAVVSGRKLGRTIGVPTANLLLPEGVIVPKYGVYACRVYIQDQIYPAVTNIGTRPTVGGHRVTVEPWILDFEGDLYGKEITLAFYKFLRPEETFPSLEELRAEIRNNAEQTRKFFENT